MLGKFVVVAVILQCVARGESRTCGSIEVKNSDTNMFLDKLSGCTSINGDLKIVLCERFTEEDYKKLRFPELREIRGYFTMYRVSGLRSLSLMFPNLSIIRGETLFWDYSLILVNVRDLEEVRSGFDSLKVNSFLGLTTL